MMQVITPEFYGVFAEELAEMHRLRYRVFKDRLQWDVEISGDMEVDEFDALHPIYLIQRARDHRIQGCVRMLPSMGPTMLREAFPALLDGNSFQGSPSIWESSRFALDVDDAARTTLHGLTSATYELFAGMLEFGLSRHLTDIVTVTDTRIERILRRAGWSYAEPANHEDSATPRQLLVTSRCPWNAWLACGVQENSGRRYFGSRR